MASTRSAIARTAATCLAAIAVLLTGYVLVAPSAAALSTGDAAGYHYDTSADAAPPAGETESVGEPGEAGEASLVLTNGLVHVDNSGSRRSFVAPRELPAARQVDAAWGVSNYWHGGLISGIEHINYRHAFDSGFDNVSPFAQGTSVRQIQGYIDDALRYGTVTPNGSSGYRIVYDTASTLGTDVAGNAVSGVQVYVRDGIIQTAFPVAVP